VAGYIVRRILTGLLMIFALTLITYLVFATVPADPGIYLTGLRTTPAQLKAADHALGVDRPIYIQYLHFVQGMLHGNLGTSYASGTPVSSIIRAALPVTAFDRDRRCRPAGRHCPADRGRLGAAAAHAV
jgi:peptide/nickel transport system permease protein